MEVSTEETVFDLAESVFGAIAGAFAVIAAVVVGWVFVASFF